MGTARLVAIGDIQPDCEVPEKLFDRVADQLEWGDLRFAQLECTLSERGTVRGDVQNPAHRIHPKNVKALTNAGHSIDVITFAGNNNLDYGDDAFFDTLKILGDNSLDYVGAGGDLSDARAPLYREVNGVKIAWVNFCSILRRGFEATATSPGISPLKIRTYYEPLENIEEQPGTPARTVTVPDRADFDAAMDTIREAKEHADIVIGCFHWGVHFTHDLAEYQAEVAYAAIDNGCDLIIGTHPHCLQAVDVYKGKYIFYSLGNFAFLQGDEAAMGGVAKYLSSYGMSSESDLTVHPHPQHCRKTIMLQIEATPDGISRIGCIPVYLNNDAQPEIQEPGEPMHEEIVDLMTTLCDEIGTQVEVTGREFEVLREKRQPVDTRRLLSDRRDSYPWVRRLSAESGQSN